MPRSRKTNASRRKPWGRWAAGLALLVPAGLFTAVLSRYLVQFRMTSYTQLAFVTGAGVYLVMHLLLWKPIFMHVMGHELTHALWAVLLGGRIKSLLVSPQGGQVTLSKTNFVIALAPYFFPIYTFFILPVYYIAAPPYYPLLSFFIGFTLAFHIALTLHSMRERQSDIQEVGFFFSLSFVYLMNLLVIVIVIAVVAPDVLRLSDFFLASGQMAWKLIHLAFAGMAEWRQ